MTAPAKTPDLRWMWLAAEALLVITSITSVLMLERVFLDSTFVSPLIFVLIVSHGLLIAMRWLGFGASTSALVSLAGTAVAVVAVNYSSTAIAAVIPTSSTIDQMQLDLDQAQQVFETLKAPVPPITGFLVIASFAFWVFAVAADWAAFRLFSPGQALVPFVAVLIFVSLLGVDENRVSATATTLVAGVLFLLAHRAAARAAHGIWLGRGPARGYASLMAAGGVVALVASLVGIIGGPEVPGADEAPLVEIGQTTGQDNRPLEVVSPLVQIQPRLINQSEDILFTVTTNERAYWRIAALDVFDGALWRSQGQFRAAGDKLPVGYPADAPTLTINQTFDLGSLNVVWAPAAYLPTSFENLSGSGVNFESESATFIVDTRDQAVSDGLVYQVESQVPSFTPALLQQLAATSDATVDPRYLDLPGDYSPLARATAIEVTAGADDPYGKALLLQNYFRDNFTYDVNVAKGHDIQRLEDFLSVQRGYCEQFAGTYASMARAIGIPARVATGFTAGDPDPENPGTYLVRGRHAHAWPEVFIAGAGWVAFEPTPGRGAPNATDYTGVAEAQDNGMTEAERREAERLAAEAAAAAAAQATPTPQPPSPEELALLNDIEPSSTEIGATESGGRGLLILAIAIAAILGWLIGVPALKRLRERRRIDRAGSDTRRRVTLAWAATADRLETFGLPPDGSETLAEYADRIDRDVHMTGQPFTELTELAVVASYRAEPPSSDDVERAESLSALIRRQLDSRQPWPVRGANELDPRPLLRIKDPIVARATRLAEGAKQ